MDLDHDQARRRFSASATAVLGTVTDIGGADPPRPHLVPITFALHGDVLVSAVDHKPKRHRGLRRLANIDDDPRVSLLVDHYADDWDQLWWVRADGLARVLPPGSEPVEWLGQKYPQYRDRPPEGPVIRVEITKWVGWAAGEVADAPDRQA